MDPATIALLLGGTAAQLFSTGRAADASKENLDFQKQRAAIQDRFARAGRTDAYGNTTRYDEALNQWLTDLTPAQRALVKAGEREQTMGLTVDAARNREARARLARVGAGAEGDFNKASAGYRYDLPESEGSIRSKLARLLTVAKGPGGGSTNFQAIRQSGNIPTAVSTDSSGGPMAELAKTLLQARSQALTESTTREGAKSSKYLPAMQSFMSQMTGGANAPIIMPRTGEDVDKQQSDMAKLLAQVSESGGRAVGDAYNLNVGALGNTKPDLRYIAQLYATSQKNKGPTPIMSGTTGSNPAEPSPWKSAYGDPWYEGTQGTF